MKILDIIISSDLKWNLHIDNVVTTRVNGKLFMLKMLKKFNFALEDLLTIYMRICSHHVLPFLAAGCIIG